MPVEVVPNLSRVPDPVAVQFRAEALAWGGQSIVEAWDFWVQNIHAHPDVTLSELRDLFIEWRNGFGPPVDFDYAVSALEVRFGVVAETEEEEWALMRGIILSKTPETWRGEPTGYADGYRVSGEVTADFGGATVELAGQTEFVECRNAVLVNNGFGYRLHLCEGME